MRASVPIRWEAVPRPVQMVTERLEGRGYKAFLVGGLPAGSFAGGNAPGL